MRLNIYKMSEYNPEILDLIDNAGLKPGCLAMEVQKALGRQLTGEEVYGIEYIRCVVLAPDAESESIYISSSDSYVEQGSPVDSEIEYSSVSHDSIAEEQTQLPSVLPKPKRRSASPKRRSESPSCKKDKYDSMKYEKAQNGMTETKSGKYTIICYFSDGVLHRQRNAAKIISKNGKIQKQYYYCKGKLHRTGGPCIINHADGIDEYWENGKFIKKIKH